MITRRRHEARLAMLAQASQLQADAVREYERTVAAAVVWEQVSDWLDTRAEAFRLDAEHPLTPDDRRRVARAVAAELASLASEHSNRTTAVGE